MIRQGNAKDSPGDADNLTAEERQALEALAGSRESEARKQERARIVFSRQMGMGRGRSLVRLAACRVRYRSGVCATPATAWRA